MNFILDLILFNFMDSKPPENIYYIIDNQSYY